MKSRTVFLGLFLFSLLTPLLGASAGFEERLRDAELAGDRQRVAEVCREWYASGAYSAGLLYWNYNALISLDPGAILITRNEHDTYPAFLLQNALDVRADVQVLSMQLLENQGYRDRLAGLKNLQWGAAGVSLDAFLKALLQTPNPVYFGVALDQNVLEANKQKLYLTGLALKYSAKPFDNTAVLRYNYENRFLTDYLKINLFPETEPDAVKQLNLHYVPAFLLLYRHYTASGDFNKAAELQTLSLNIARAGNREPEVRAYFYGKSEPGEAVQSNIAPKSLEKGMKKISDKLYAAETELSNEQYELFLQDLLKNKDFDQLNQCKSAKTDWLKLLPEDKRGLSEQQIFEHGNPDAADHPVQNITQDAAKRYCEWITKVYNAADGKKKFKKVRFRLPTAAEWETAAMGGIKKSPYPWGGYYLKNAKGCYLCNLNATEPCKDCPAGKDAANDGGFFTVAVSSYFPNNYGFYCMAGNVAEMIDEPGKTKGGSWQDDGYHCQISPVQSFDKPSPAIGFRVFMDVIEE